MKIYDIIYFRVYIQQSSSHKPCNTSACEKFTCLLWKPKTQCRVEWIPPLNPILNDVNHFHILKQYFIYALVLHIHLRQDLPSGFFRSSLAIKTFNQLLIYSTCEACVFLFHLISITLFVKS
jgi:hypothetical protein